MLVVFFVIPFGIMVAVSFFQRARALFTRRISTSTITEPLHRALRPGPGILHFHLGAVRSHLCGDRVSLYLLHHPHAAEGPGGVAGHPGVGALPVGGHRRVCLVAFALSNGRHFKSLCLAGTHGTAGELVARVLGRDVRHVLHRLPIHGAGAVSAALATRPVPAGSRPNVGRLPCQDLFLGGGGIPAQPHCGHVDHGFCIHAWDLSDPANPGPTPALDALRADYRRGHLPLQPAVRCSDGGILHAGESCPGRTHHGGGQKEGAEQR